jgi:hypothetical protein
MLLVQRHNLVSDASALPRFQSLKQAVHGVIQIGSQFRDKMFRAPHRDPTWMCSLVLREATFFVFPSAAAGAGIVATGIVHGKTIWTSLLREILS